MSRGLGKIQRAILSALADHQPHHTLELVVAAFAIKKVEGVYLFNSSQHAAVRRALRLLLKAGHIEQTWSHLREYPRLWIILGDGSYEEGACSRWPRRTLDEIAADI
jgi:hypothetical protein